MSDFKKWSVCLIEANKFEAQIIVDLLRNAGVDKVKVFLDSREATEALEVMNCNVIIMALESTPIEAVEWTKQFRRNKRVIDRKAAVFVTSRAFLRSNAEQLRHAGANALIGKPVSGQTLLATIKKVLSNPRPFIDAEGYVGPCRRAGIVTAGTGSRRRKSDDGAAGGRAAPTLADIVAALSKEVIDYSEGRSNRDKVGAALRPVHAYAVNAGDGPMMRTGAALTLLMQAQNIQADAMKTALCACATAMTQLAELASGDPKQRDAIAEGVRAVVAKTATQKAA